MPIIPQPPSGWERILRIRTKFVDVYLKEHWEYAAQGVKLEKFSFQTPRPLQEDYAKKHIPTPSYDANDGMCMCIKIS
ncbi:hypothetical protein H5410_036451 [Solanum commersonii]|uniref:Uncharacterized protein n=1 Tax=Solanum commersonii TaxID=4109 RepID=A0A9J5Y3K5_SOLCO|nr:hypothetical protein H5410_036451 [Solanum commersonii]